MPTCRPMRGRSGTRSSRRCASASASRLAEIVAVGVVDRPALLRGVDRDVAVGRAGAVGVAPYRHGLARVAHDPADIAIAAAFRRGADLHVVDRVVQLAIGAAEAPRPPVVDHRLEAEDRLVLMNRIDVVVDFGTQVTDRAVSLRHVDRADLRAEDRCRIARTVVLLDLPAAESVVGALVEQSPALLDVDDIGHGQEIAAEVAEQLRRAVTLHVPREAEARREHVDRS